MPVPGQRSGRLAHGRQLLDDAALDLEPVGIVVLDQRVRRIEDGLVRAEIFRDHDLPGVRIVAQEAQHVRDGRAAEPIDRLVVVTGHRHVAMPRRQHFHQLELRIVRVLKFVDEHVLEPPLVRVQHMRSRTQQPQRLHDLIAEVDLVVPGHHLLVPRVRRGQLRLRLRPVQLLLVVGVRAQPRRAREIGVG